jgi:hypothetical protein
VIVTAEADHYGQRRAGAGADQPDDHKHSGNPRKLAVPMSASAWAGASAAQFSALVELDHPALVPERTGWPLRMRVSGGVPESTNGFQRLVTNRRQPRLISYANIVGPEPHGIYAH